MVKLRMGDLSIITIPDLRCLGIVLYPSWIDAVLMLPVVSVALCEPFHSFLHLLPHYVSEMPAPQMVTLCHPETTENHEEDEHCPYGSLVDFDEMKTSALGVGDEVLRPLLI